jgi:hypothetical protein
LQLDEQARAAGETEKGLKEEVRLPVTRALSLQRCATVLIE